MGLRYALGGALVTLLVIAGWWAYRQWQTGRVEFTTDGDAVVAQVLAEDSDTPIGEPFDLATRAVVELPDGDYRLRVNGKGRLGRTFRFAVNRGETLAHSVSIDEGRLLGGDSIEPGIFRQEHHELRIPFPLVVAALELQPGKASFIEWSKESFLCRDGVTGEVVWDAFHPEKPFGQGDDPVPMLRILGRHSDECRFLERAHDLDGDGTGDIVCCFRREAVFIAFSGKDGSILWSRVADAEGAAPKSSPLEEAKEVARAPGPNRELVGEPATGDLDGDGVTDFVITTLSTGRPAGSEPRQVASVVAVSGKTRLALWKYTDEVMPRQGAVLVRGRDQAFVAVVGESKWLGLDAQTGKRRLGPIELHCKPDVPVQHADLDGDGEPEILALGHDAGGATTLAAVSINGGRQLWARAVDGGYDQSQMGVAPPDYPLVLDLDGKGAVGIVVADSGAMPRGVGYRGVRMIDGRTGATRWRRPMRPQTAGNDGVAQMIAAPDLDGDGMNDLVAVSLFDGMNPPSVLQPFPENSCGVYVDAISGSDGRALWWWKTKPAVFGTKIWKPMWWGRGRDGWPLLAVSLGGAAREALPGHSQIDFATPANVHLLEASTGEELHRVMELSRASTADFDGDGIADLWGEVGNELRAFRGEAPEAWRALGSFKAADSTGDAVEDRRDAIVDLNGDGIADAVSLRLTAPGGGGNYPKGSRTAVARSGRDGRTIWKTVIDPVESWLAPNNGDYYEIEAFPLPDGDFNGDGTPDVVVCRRSHPLQSQRFGRGNRVLAFKLLSGRTGATLWSAGVLPRELDAQAYATYTRINAATVESKAMPDLFIRHLGAAQAVAGPKGNTAVVGTPFLARISGRDGRVLWDMPLEAEASSAASGEERLYGFSDLDGDGALDALFMLADAQRGAGIVKPLVATSLRDGKRLWTRALESTDNGHTLDLGDTDGPVACIGDLNGDGRPEVVVLEVVAREGVVGGHHQVTVRALDGRDGNVKWTWKPGDLSSEDGRVVLADFDRRGSQYVCASFVNADETRQIVVLDGEGNERARRDVGSEPFRMLHGADLDADGCDELVVQEEHNVRALNRDLKDVWSAVVRDGSLERVVPGRGAKPGFVVASPTLALDGLTGKARWLGPAPLRESSDLRPGPQILDPGDLSRLPLFLENDGRSTVCRVGMATTPEAGSQPPRGAAATTRRAGHDPRWARPLPWVSRLKGPFGPWGLLAAGALAFINVALPLCVLWLAGARRRSFPMRALMALPIAAVIPLISYLTLAPWLPVGSEKLLASEQRVFLTGTLGGVPIVLFVCWVVGAVMRRRWRVVLALIGLTVLASVGLAAGWIGIDQRTMAPMEHYDWEGWALIVVLGGYVAAVLWGVGKLVLGMTIMVRRRAHRITTTI